MCRIVGFQEFSGYTTDLNSMLIGMRDTMCHGGPDDAGLYTDDSCRVALGHRRLSILDLSTLGHQPMANSDRTKWISYNGEIYNYRAIRHELEKLGCTFHSNSDTEVILHAYEQWGLDCVHKFRGMWAFAIWDSVEKKWILSRDRMGVKPLYWTFQNNVFMFASELKALMHHSHFKKQISQEGLSLYLQYGYIASPYTIFDQTFKLEPGHHLIFQDKTFKKVSYWDVSHAYEGRPLHDTAHAKDTLENLLNDSIALRMVSDVPVGIFLSGGIDSTLVTALAQKQHSQPLKTFTIGFSEDHYNEAPAAKAIAQFLGTDHHEMTCTPKEAFEALLILSDVYDEPFADPSAIPTYLVSRLASQSVKVALSADGGDEQFCGYSNYLRIPRFSERINRLPLKSFIQACLSRPTLVTSVYRRVRCVLPAILQMDDFLDRLKKLHSCLSISDTLGHFDAINRYFLTSDLRQAGLPTIISQLDLFRQPGSPRLDAQTLMMVYELSFYLIDDLLVKVDRATMRHALEGREPLLDHKLIEFSAALPLHLKYRNGKSKYLLREILKDHVPEHLWERPKKGFCVPIQEWFRHDLASLYAEHIQPQYFKAFPFHDAFIDTQVCNWTQQKGSTPNKMWLLFVLSKWAQRYL